jgi:uncharacterized protein YuzB (UPF0349 family)
MIKPLPVLRVCRTNAERFSLPVPEWEGRGWSVDCVTCLAECGDCEAGPFVELNGEPVFTDSLAQLAAKLAAAAPNAA